MTESAIFFEKTFPTNKVTKDKKEEFPILLSTVPETIRQENPFELFPSIGTGITAAGLTRFHDSIHKSVMTFVQNVIVKW